MFVILKMKKYLLDNVECIFNVGPNSTDSGASACAMSYEFWKTHFHNVPLSDTETIILGYTGNEIKVAGKINVNVVYNNIINNLDFFIV